MQLLEVFSIAAILAITRTGRWLSRLMSVAFEGLAMSGEPATVFATGGACLCGLATGLATCFGAHDRDAGKLVGGACCGLRDCRAVQQHGRQDSNTLRARQGAMTFS